MITKKEILTTFAVIVVLAACAYAFSHIRPLAARTTASATSTAEMGRPPLTDEVKAQLAASKGFQVLVSYTDGGFEPNVVTIKKGDTIRFTNNSREDLWVAATGASGAVYPAGTGGECGQSAFDGCRSISRGEFWEFTFNVAGTWSYQDNRDTKMTGVVQVE